tara:strand:- start:852 stop:1049 length:198 start_codon:yes stop_codon:yes gene_type:complete
MIYKTGTPYFPQNCEIEDIEIIELTDEKAYQDACMSFHTAFEAELAKEKEMRGPAINLSNLVFTE